MWAIPRIALLLVGITGSSLGGWAGQFHPTSDEGVWRSARYHGGSDFEFAERLVLDAQGNAYLLGRTFSGDMHPSVAPVSSNRGEPASATFVLKLDPDGLLIYAMEVGTGFTFLPLDIAVGRDGAAHVLARDGDLTHVMTIDAAGSQRVYHVTFDGLARDPIFPKAIAVDDAGHTVLAGWSEAGPFVARLDSRGSVFDIRVVPARGDARDVAVDDKGDVYVVGTISSDDLPTTAATLQPRYNGGTCVDVYPPLNGPPQSSPCPDAFLFKLTRSGELAYASYFGGTGWDEGHTIAVDRTGAVVIAGLTRSLDLPTGRAAQPQCKRGFAALACGDAFVAKIDPTGGAVVFATYLGGTDTEGVSGIAVDEAGAAYVAGSITGSGLPVYRAPQPASGGGSDGFVVAFGPFGDLLWSTYVGGAADERIVGVGVAGGIVHIGGETTSPAWAVGGAAFSGARDLFSARLWDPPGR